MGNETVEISPFFGSALYGTLQNIVENMSIHRYSGFYLGPIHTNPVRLKLYTQLTRNNLVSKRATNKQTNKQAKTKTIQNANTLLRVASKRCCINERFHWFRLDRRPIRVKKNAVSKIFWFVWSGPYLKPTHSLFFNLCMLGDRNWCRETKISR